MRVESLFRQRFGEPCAAISHAPGRVNLLGEHVDYNEGFVLPAAIDRATYVAFSASGSDQSTLWAEDFGEQVSFSHAALRERNGPEAKSIPGWAKYPMGVAWALLGHRLAVQGMNAVFASDVPRGAGLSSSASVELAFATAWQAMGRWSLPPMELAVLCQKAENEYVGLRCGIMDQAASACGKQGRVLLLDCRSLELQNLPLPQSAAIIIADSGVRHALSSTGYNDRRAACETAVRILKQKMPAIRALRDVTMDEFDRRSGDLPAEVQKRARHVIQEIGRTQRAVPLLQEGNLPAFGELMDASHASLRDLYEVSCPELDVMVRIAQSLEGCFGARLTGGGFGGCTVNLVAAHQAAGFTEALAHGYEAETRRHSEIYICHASEGAGIL